MVSRIREGTAGPATIVVGSVGILLLLVSVILLMRLFHVVRNRAKLSK